MRTAVLDFALALAAIALIVSLGNAGAGDLGITVTALLLILPVIWTASRTDALTGAGMALAASIAFNYFLLPPLYTFAIAGPTYVVTFVVFVAVALVTGGFAASLRERRAEAAARAADSELESTFLADLALAAGRPELDRRALTFLAERFGDAQLFTRQELADQHGGLAPLDAAAGVWALDHDAVTGYASEVMPAADFRFVSFGRGATQVLAVPTMPAVHQAEGAVLSRLAGHWGQARDHFDALAERRTREEAEARDRTRRALLAALGHDFRTPLTVLKEGLARLPGAAEAGLPKEIERLRMLGEDLIASARLEAGLPLALEPVDLVDTFGRLEMRSQTAASSARLAIELTDELPLVLAEPVMLGHLLGNVVENALRHACERVDLIACEEDGGVVLRIVDDGPGVAMEVADSIFEPFVSGRSASGGGSGLGLAIARDLASAMGAQLTLDPPASDAGAAFRLRLPLAPVRGDPK